MLRMLSCITTAITTLSCTPLCCQSPRRRMMELRLIGRFSLFCILFISNSVFPFRTISIVFKF
ncbi:hypothetical protein M6B38_395165 [Iris pallida]|uniref:Uncharacterized protein n=1 Tax=Iris pallida TaxID=29817 RepID=A0AAX6FXP0_IRIPA|nr:hypothetical protein M6B38_395165 [Iris pallida]